MTIRRELAPLPIAWVRKTRFAQTIGVELPSSGKGTFQRTLSFGPHLTGRSFSGVWPLPSAPCQAGQLAAETGTPSPPLPGATMPCRSCPAAAPIVAQSYNGQSRSFGEEAAMTTSSEGGSSLIR